jgi:hypothetical protein
MDVPNKEDSNKQENKVLENTANSEPVKGVDDTPCAEDEKHLNYKITYKPSAEVKDPKRNYWIKISDVINMVLIFFAWLMWDNANQSFNKTVERFHIQDSTDSVKELKSDMRRYRDDSISNIRDSLTREAINMQIAAFQENKKQFEFENRPLLQIKDFASHRLRIGENIEISVVVNNIGKKAAKVIKHKYRVGVADAFEHLENREKWYKTEYEINNRLLNQNQNFEIQGAAKPIQAENWGKYMTGEIFIFLYGEIFYEDIYTHKTYVYKFRVKNSDPNYAVLKDVMTFDVLLNETKEIKMARIK